MENKHLNDNDLKPRKWLLYVLIVISIVIVVVLANKVITDRNEKKKEQDKFLDNFFENVDDIISDTNDAINDDKNYSDVEIRSFNAIFEMYVGTEYGSSVSRLIDKVNTNNKTNDEHIITVVFGDINTADTDEIRSIKKSLDDWTEYEVILDYDENGFVNLVTIEK